ncbi:MAG TPA: glucose 1-dehydrogenase [Terriglobales bacterium]|nr:glucose 1-dehydrogenase [Terriglobales bacterium]
MKEHAHSNGTFRLEGKVAAITGGASGIGRAIAETFAAHGARVCVVDLDETLAKTVAAEITKAGGVASAYTCDVTQRDSVKNAFDKIRQEGPIEILVNSAGIAHIGKLENTSEEDFDRIFRVNVKGVYNCMFTCIEKMKEARKGVILNLASIAGTAGLSDRFAYSMSKGAVLSMTLSVAKDYISYNIRCNCISPARVFTPFVDQFVKKYYPGHEKEMLEELSRSQPMGRMAQPQEVASLALFLCSNEASFITGTDYPIDGGFFNLR